MQMNLCTDGTKSYAIYNYAEMNWGGGQVTLSWDNYCSNVPKTFFPRLPPPPNKKNPQKLTKLEKRCKYVTLLYMKHENARVEYQSICI